MEPVLQPVSDPGSFALATANTQESARLYCCEWLLDCCERCFVDVRVFNPFAPSNVNSVSAAYIIGAMRIQSGVLMARGSERLNSLPLLQL